MGDNLIEAAIPSQWTTLQSGVAQILQESGYEAETDKAIKLARGSANLDVFASDPETTPEMTTCVECKLWNKNVPQEKVHAFRTVVGDAGANLGLMVSKKGFQRGAHEAAKHSNIHLLTWDDFQRWFVERWYRRFMAPTMMDLFTPLSDYTEPINSRVSGKAARLTAENKDKFMKLRSEYRELGNGLLSFWIPMQSDEPKRPALPLRSWLGPWQCMTDEILDAVAYRPLMKAFQDHVPTVLARFDEVFGERA